MHNGKTNFTAVYFTKGTKAINQRIATTIDNN